MVIINKQNMKKDIVLVDIDGTVSIVGDRLKHLQGKKDWDAFYKACGDDEPNQNVIDIVKVLGVIYKIVF